jgi:1,4-alpha-glucan branching enzyme
MWCMAVYKESKNGNVTFVFDKENAKSVFVAGDFNNWDSKAKKMTKAKDGSFRARLSLTPGQYQYKFIVDGKWVVDDDAERKVQNQFGTVNSVVEI